MVKEVNCTQRAVQPFIQEMFVRPIPIKEQKK
jgi:hypothetical protein